MKANEGHCNIGELIVNAFNAFLITMTRPPSKSGLMSQPLPEADRIRYLLENRWAGNQNEMARDIGCSQSSLSRVVGGKLRPGKRLLKLLMDFGVSQEWLYRGKGEPLVERRRASADVDFRLPVVASPLPGPPSEHRDRLDGHEFPVAAALFGTTRCWYEVGEGVGILRNNDARLAPGDLLLLEYDLGRFHDLFEIDRRIAVSWVGSKSLGEERHLEVGVVEYSFGPDEDDLALVVGEPDYRRWKDVKFVSAQIVKKNKAANRFIRLGSTTVPVSVDGEGNLKPLSDSERQPITYSIQRSDIVAVCVGMFRR